MRAKDSARLLWRGIRAASVLLGILVIVVHATPLVHWWGGSVAGEWREPEGEILVVLAADNLGDGLMGAGTYWRCIYGMWAFRKGGFRKLVLSGGTQPAPVAESMRQFMISQNVPAGSIVVEGRSRSTRESAVFTGQLLQGVAGRRVLLTSDYHVYRASRAFAAAGQAVLPCYYPDAIKRGMNWRFRWPAFLDLLEESLKVAYYRLRGWI
jgi:uncharacterized SAM-binding protein YcdF (DUF218 family)